MDINERYQIGVSVSHLQKLMVDVTAKEINADTVNAACNCVAGINNTMKTAIAAAKFIADQS